MNRTTKARSTKARSTKTRWAGLPFTLALLALSAAAPLAAALPKPTPPIAITHRVSGSPQVGQPVEIILSIAAEGDMSGVSVSFAADDPLAMIDPVDSLAIGALRAGEGTDVTVTVLPLLDRTHYLSVTVTALIDGTPQTRSIAVPIRLPGSELRKSDPQTAGNPDASVRSFRAIETVR